jgi:hypothetical protein
MTTFTHFYRELYSRQNTNHDIQTKYLGYTKQLTVEQQVDIDREITAEDIQKAIKHMNTDKSSVGHS